MMSALVSLTFCARIDFLYARDDSRSISTGGLTGSLAPEVVFPVAPAADTTPALTRVSRRLVMASEFAETDGSEGLSVASVLGWSIAGCGKVRCGYGG